MTGRISSILRLSQNNADLASEIEFCQWLGEALPGDHIVYHKGFLTIDTFPEKSNLEPAARARLSELAATARWAFGQGLVHLVQRRLGPGRFAYIAIARPKRRCRKIALSALLAEREAA